MGGPNAPRRFSGMQKQVLALYRGFLRAARPKPPDDRRRVESIVSAEFRRNARQVDRKNFLYIEYLLRRGRKQLDQLKSPDTTGLDLIKKDERGMYGVYQEKHTFPAKIGKAVRYEAIFEYEREDD